MTIANSAPAENTIDVRRDWSLTADITAPDGVDSVAVKVNGSAVTDTETSITDGKRVEYTPGASSGYGERVEIEMIATLTEAITWAASTAYTTVAIRIGDGVHYECTTAGTSGSTEPTWPTTIDETVNDGTAVWTCKADDYIYTWRFTTKTGMTEATTAPPPNVVVAKDISLTAAEADEELATGKYIIWLPDKTHPLIVTDAQAEAVGTVIVDGNTCNRHRRTLLVDRLDTNDDIVADLQEGKLIAFTATAIAETTKKAQVMAVRQVITQDDDVQYRLLVQYYEAV